MTETPTYACLVCGDRDICDICRTTNRLTVDDLDEYGTPPLPGLTSSTEGTQ